MTGRYKSYNYEITTDPGFLNDKYGISPELFRQLGNLHQSAQKGGSRVIEKLINLIGKYPHVPHLKHYLSVAYISSGNIKKGREVNHWTLNEHPDYLFGRLNLAFEYYHDGLYDKMPEVVGNLMEIQDLYPERNCFHISEITSFNKMAIMYFCAVGNLEAAETRYEILEKLVPHHPDTEQVFPYLMKARLLAAQKRMDEESKTRISVKVNNIKAVQRDKKLEFANREVDWLYNNDLRIEQAKLRAILRLPYESLVSDLTLVLKDSIYRFEYFKNLADKKKKWNADIMSFPLHAIYLLGELKAKESLNDILETFRQGEEFIEFWYGDFMTGSLWEPLYYIADKQLDVLKQFLLTPGIWTYTRSEITSCAGQIALHQPKRKAEIISWFSDLFSHLAGASLEDNIIDSDFIGLAICEVIDFRGFELLPSIKKLYDLGYVGTGICGNYAQVEMDIHKPKLKSDIKELLNIFDRYNQIITTWSGYNEEEDYSDLKKEEHYHADPKTGRNDPCPCGSGKKYKKCCLKKLS